jgi:imidazolonepropionase-like amidohydrolase
MRLRARSILPICALTLMVGAAANAAETSADEAILLRPARVFDGTHMHAGWNVLVKGERIAAVGESVAVPSGTREIDLPGETLLPGLIEGHGHLFLHPYNEKSWDDQVLHESLALRTARAVNAARLTMRASSRGRVCWSRLAPSLPAARTDRRDSSPGWKCHREPRRPVAKTSCEQCADRSPPARM